MKKSLLALTLVITSNIYAMENSIETKLVESALALQDSIKHPAFYNEDLKSAQDLADNNKIDSKAIENLKSIFSDYETKYNEFTSLKESLASAETMIQCLALYRELALAIFQEKELEFRLDQEMEDLELLDFSD